MSQTDFMGFKVTPKKAGNTYTKIPPYALPAFLKPDQWAGVGQLLLKSNAEKFARDGQLDLDMALKESKIPNLIKVWEACVKNNIQTPYSGRQLFLAEFLVGENPDGKIPFALKQDQKYDEASKRFVDDPNSSRVQCKMNVWCGGMQFWQTALKNIAFWPEEAQASIVEKLRHYYMGKWALKYPDSKALKDNVDKQVADLSNLVDAEFWTQEGIDTKFMDEPLFRETTVKFPKGFEEMLITAAKNLSVENEETTKFDGKRWEVNFNTQLKVGLVGLKLQCSQSKKDNNTTYITLIADDVWLLKPEVQAK